MFDAKSLLESLVRGAQPSSAASRDAGGAASAPGSTPHGDPLSDLLESLTPDSSLEAADRDDRRGTSSSDDISSILENLAGTAGTSGGLPAILSQVFGEGASGEREGASGSDQSTGTRESLGNAIRQLSGKPPEEILARVRELIANNQFGSGAVLGGLGGILLGTGAGRSLAANAAKIGAIAVIGGLAYKAYQNYQAGRPLMAGSNAEPGIAPPPTGSGFEPEAVSNGETMTLIRAMVASAAADGRVGSAEQVTITGGLKEGGIDAEAEDFLASELNNPASIDDIAAAVHSKEEAARVYTAARLAIEPDAPAERDFLDELATRLHIEPELAAHIDATALRAAA